jgi:hypothetical protein
MKLAALTLVAIVFPALAAPKIDTLTTKPDAAKPEVELTVSVTKSKLDGDCEARIDFGDGKGRTLEFGLATKRTLRYTYAKAGSYKVSVKGTGKTPCAGEKEAALKVAGPAEKKKAEEKKPDEKKKAEKKKADKKSASAKKKEEPK